MASPLVECIPNFSDARRPEVIKQILDSIQAVPGVHVLDHHSDMDHNRTVVTYVGTPAAVEEAAYQAIAKAAQLINLDDHQGEHPRMGASDVVPFVPISDVSMQECIEMARRLGKRVGESLQIPVFLYEDAASIPEKQNLENIRRGQYEAIKSEIGSSPVRTPDFGPCLVGPAGATVIGARQPLIAFNIYLTTNDVSIAQKIARVVRNSSGGLRYVKGMGVLVEGRAQVSMNLTNFKKTPIARVVELVRREAERYGVGIHHSELVGLIPQEALIDAAQWYTQMDAFDPQQILEQRLYEIMRSKSPAQLDTGPDFLDELAAATPTPGGGSAAAHTAAAAAALVSMVGRLTTGKKKYADVLEQMWALVEQAETLRKELTAAVDKDAQAFTEVINAYKLPKETEEEQNTRDISIQKATMLAAQVPLNVAEMAVDVMRLAVKAATIGNINAISDAGSGVFLAHAALKSACLNVRINTLGLSSEGSKKSLLTAIKQLETQAETIDQETRSIMKNRGGLPES
ncbi:MAG: glutamate formimidoyltransferase [Chloroflexi bacterium HGW-Chloroflexi-10]|nr:MAG: glutamate formimidoyltransferase [Chloroflexi bacterium HGW-Chloroflexi-10]